MNQGCCSNQTERSQYKPCPSCGQKGQPVKKITVQSILKPGKCKQLEENDFWVCENPDCSVLYYSSSGQTYLVEDARVRVGFKVKEDPIPVCYCHGVTKKDILANWEKTRSFSELLNILGITGECQCEIKNPKGRCCVDDIRKIVLEELDANPRQIQASCCSTNCCS
jgi:bacterioferritin-associated ferredoxin